MTCGSRSSRERTRRDKAFEENSFGDLGSRTASFRYLGQADHDIKNSDGEGFTVNTRAILTNAISPKIPAKDQQKTGQNRGLFPKFNTKMTICSLFATSHAPLSTWFYIIGLDDDLELRHELLLVGIQ